MESLNLGRLINKVRIEKHIDKDKLCYGLCSVSTLSRIEKSSQNIDIILVKTLLERMGIYSEKFMYILNDDDFELFEKSIYIDKHIKEQSYDVAMKELSKYECEINNYKNIYEQYICKCRAIIQNKLGNLDEAMKLFKISLECTIPDFEKINLDEYYLSNSEIDIILKYINIVTSKDKSLNFKDILSNVYKVMNRASIYELSKNRMYPKVCYMFSKLLYEEGNYKLNQEVTTHALDALALTGDLNYRADIIFLNTLSKLELESTVSHLNELLDAYYLAEFWGQDILARRIEEKVMEVYKWENIDAVPLLN